MRMLSTLTLSDEEREDWLRRRDVALRDCFSVMCPECMADGGPTCEDCLIELGDWAALHRPHPLLPFFPAGYGYGP